jgi:hypothetical protein
MNQSTTTPVAQEAIAYCTKCKLDLNHTIVAMQGDRIVKVQCKTCKAFHNYRAPKGVTEVAPEGAAPKKRKSRSEAAERRSVESEWERLMKLNVNQPAKAYSSKATFKPGDKIAHPTFGEGVINKLIHPNKFEIVFQMDVKILIHIG